MAFALSPGSVPAVGLDFTDLLFQPPVQIIIRRKTNHPAIAQLAAFPAALDVGASPIRHSPLFGYEETRLFGWQVEDLADLAFRKINTVDLLGVLLCETH